MVVIRAGEPLVQAVVEILMKAVVEVAVVQLMVLVAVVQLMVLVAVAISATRPQRPAAAPSVTLACECGH